MKYFLIFSAALCFSIGCGAQSMHIPDVKAQALNDQAVNKYIKNSANTDSVKAAIRLLDKAVKTDSTFFHAWTNKLGFECQLALYPDALKTATRIAHIFPSDIDMIFFCGVLQFKTGHKKEGVAAFSKLLQQFESLPEANEKSENLKTVLITKGIILLVLGRPGEGNAILNKLGASEHDPAVKHYIAGYIGKSSDEIINDLVSEKGK